MSYNGSGTFQINTTGQPVVTGTVISSTAFNALTADLATGLSTAITKDGQTATTARIPFAAGISSTLVTDSSSTSTGSIITAGGVGVAKALYVGTTANIAGTSTLTGTASLAANLTFTGTGNRITGDFSNATVASRVMFQTSTVNSNTILGIIPNGTGTLGQINFFSSSDPANSSVLSILNASSLSESRFQSGITGTGTYLPMTFYTGGSERARIDTSGNVGIGTSSPSNYGTANIRNITTFLGDQNITVGAYYQVSVGQYGFINSGNLNNGSAQPLVFQGGGIERMRIDSSGNVLVTNVAGLGYGTGAGGTVTQATSKSTAVTLNKPTGQITMNAAALASNTNISFTLTNSLLSATDTILIHRGSGGSAGVYFCTADGVSAGSCSITVRNTSASSLSEAIVLNFTIIKGVTA